MRERERERERGGKQRQTESKNGHTKGRNKLTNTHYDQALMYRILSNILKSIKHKPPDNHQFNKTYFLKLSTYTNSHTHAHTHTRTLSLSYTYTHTLSLPHTHTHTKTSHLNCPLTNNFLSVANLETDDLHLGDVGTRDRSQHGLHTGPHGQHRA